MKCKCGGNSQVTSTVKQSTLDGVLRYRKCEACKTRFQTLETMIETRSAGRPPNLVKFKPPPVYTPAEVSKIKAVQTAVRRKSEDIRENQQRRSRVSSYFIEDDFDDL
jgi:hypothetical protein